VHVTDLKHGGRGSWPNLLVPCAALEAFVETLADSAIRHLVSNALAQRPGLRSCDSKPNSSKNMLGLSIRRIQGTLNELLKN